MDTSKLATDPTVIAMIMGILTFIWNKVSGSMSSDLKAKIDRVEGALDSIMEAVVVTVAPGTTSKWMDEKLHAIAAQQLASVGLDPNHPLVKAMVDQVINKWLAQWVLRMANHAQGAPSDPALEAGAAVVASRSDPAELASRARMLGAKV